MIFQNKKQLSNFINEKLIEWALKGAEWWTRTWPKTMTRRTMKLEWKLKISKIKKCRWNWKVFLSKKTTISASRYENSSKLLFLKVNSATVASDSAEFQRHIGRSSERHHRPELHWPHHQAGWPSDGRSKRWRPSFVHFNYSSTQESKVGASSWKTSYEEGRFAERYKLSWS